LQRTRKIQSVIPPPSAQTAPQDVAATATPVPPELAQVLQPMARDLANVQQGIEQLQAGQEQTARENAKLLPRGRLGHSRFRNWNTVIFRNPPSQWKIVSLAFAGADVSSRTNFGPAGSR
jgi:allantoicase